MKRLFSVLYICALATLGLGAQTLNISTGDVTYQFPAAQAGDMTYTGGTQLTVMGRTFSLTDITAAYIDDTAVTDNTVSVVYSGTSAKVYVAGNVAQYVETTVSGAFVSIEQSLLLDASVGEITYALSGTSTDGQFVMDGEYKATVELNGLTLTNASGGPAVHIKDGKRINLTISGTNTLCDAAGGTQKAALHIKGHTEVKGDGTLTVTGLTGHAIKGNEYFLLKKSFTGSIVVNGAVGDGMHIGQYYEQRGGTVTISGTGDDGLQVELDTDDNGNVEDDEDNTGLLTVTAGTLTVTTATDAAKGLKSDGNIEIQGGTVNVTQSGSITVEDDDISYPSAIRSDADIVISGGTVTVKSTAEGGRGLRADGTITINEADATTSVDITANGAGGTAETAGSGSGSETAKSYRVYVSLPSTGGGGWGGPGGGTSSVWSTVYLYSSDGTQVAQLTNTVSKSSGYSTTTFYYYDFGSATSGTYYFKSANYTQRGTSYTIRSASFSAPTSGEDIYYSISSSYSTSGTTRTYSLSNVTNTYGGTSDVSEDNGTGYNAAGIKATGDVTIAAGTVTIAHSGTMSKGIKSKGTTTVSGGTLTITPTGGMQVINSDASYCAGIKTVDYVQSGGSVIINCSTGAAIRGISATNVTTDGGTLSITSSSAGQSGSSDNYTAKGIKADTKIALNAGTITIKMTGSGGKGIKSSGTYTQGLTDGTGPTLTVSTTGSSFGSSSSSGGGWGGWGGGPGGQSSGGSSAKAIKVMGTATLYGGETVITTTTDGAEGLESKTTVYIEGGKHYLFCYDDCINSSGNIYFNGGATVCYSNGNDAVDSNAGRTGAITIGDGAVFAYTTKGSPEEGLDCDNNSYIQITGNGIAISAGGAQGGGSSSSTISGAKQGYYFYTGSITYNSSYYYTVADASGNNLVTFKPEASVSSTLSLITAKGMTSGSAFTVKSGTTAPTDATTAWHGLYLGSSLKGTTSVISATAK
ncbi:MAG: carbohydrate-binding domain-containing protein [Bacteroidaceae bacterium]|nr:carbohydrate-binding domain-containing protein [Bacteroidaceae bacterium]